MSDNIRYEETTLEKALTWINWRELVIFGGDSGMGDIITGIDNRFRKKDIKVLIAHHPIDGVVGWAWSLNYYNHNDHRRRAFMIFVKDEYRRQGIGSEMIKWGRQVASRFHIKFMCFPWDQNSDAFFQSQKIKEQNQGWW